MSAWEIIKERLTKGHRQGSAGYLVQVWRAGKLYADLLKHGIIPRLEEQSADEELVQALMTEESFVAIGLIKSEEV